ncbi:hypothetical protein LJR219_002858 [Phenylobacterium sp. LjRoot219]|uniref:hypothetical protein n=1 Tax=Phenylobacterium sp. LjRoot219 TaxID=3342283 RepID=UPI003ED0E2E0
MLIPAPADAARVLLDALLAETPEVRDAPRQQALTEQFLAPELASLEALLLGLRADIDPVLQRERPHRGAKPYPSGQCLGITAAVQRRLSTVDPAQLPPPAARGYAALAAFARSGGVIRRVWGDLRGRYFQTALVVGALYVDVANDTVVATKPKVEILPFTEAGFSPIADYGHYARIADSYWGGETLPNHLLPDLAPYLPVLRIDPAGRVNLAASTRYMLGLTLANRFSPSETALSAPPLAATRFSLLAAALQRAGIQPAPDAAHGRNQALACCQRYRAEGRHDAPEALVAALRAAEPANRALAAVNLAAKAA